MVQSCAQAPRQSPGPGSPEAPGRGASGRGVGPLRPSLGGGSQDTEGGRDGPPPARLADAASPPFESGSHSAGDHPPARPGPGIERERSDSSYRGFLRGRWPIRTKWLATYATIFTPAVALLDWVFTRSHAPPPSLLDIVSLRAPCLMVPAVGFLAQRLAPRWAGLPTLVMAISVAWAWGNDAGFFQLGLAGSMVQGVAMALILVTTATFMPLTMAGRAGVLALMALGHLGLDLAWPQLRSISLRLWADAVILAFALSATVVFENFNASQRRGLALRRQLERTVEELQEARLRAERAVEEIGHLAAEVAHEVNSPLAAVKVNVGWLQQNGADQAAEPERAEVASDALSAIDRIARTMARLKLQSAASQARLAAGAEAGPVSSRQERPSS